MLLTRLLGAFDVRNDDQPVALASRPAQSLFGYLILYPGTAHRREKLAGLLWPDSLEETARDNLRHALWRLRKALPSDPENGYVIANDLTIAFNAAADYWLDAQVVDRAGENATADELMAALAAYGGELLPGSYDEWVLAEREHLQSSFGHHMARLMSLLEDEQRWLDMLDWGERWIKLGQKPEPAYRALMTAHAAKGDMSKVAATFKRCVKSLHEFGIEPSEQTQELYGALKSGQGTLGGRSVSPTAVEKETSSTIPVPLTSFVGRETELEEIAGLLSSSRLFTLTGPGGVGKTRLAVQTASDSIGRFKDGVVWVGLASLSDGNLIPQEIAHSLKVQEASNLPSVEALKTYLKSKELLLVLDNCEHLIRDCAQVTEQLLAACPRLRILATSTEALGLFNETSWQVPSLTLPEDEGALALSDLQGLGSVRLFAERARSTKPGFALDEKSAHSVAQICIRLDGIPLAIELAAARVKMLSVDEIAARLDDRFSLLTSGSRTAVPRHQTLRATIDWSYELLADPERVLLRRLSVFSGGFALEAAEAVCSQGVNRGDILALMGRLVDKSLVIAEQASRINETRYRLLETIRHYALERLMATEEARAIRDKHLKYFLDLTGQSEPRIFSRESAYQVSRLAIEIDNIRAAMDWATNSGKATFALQMAGSLVYFWWSHAQLPSELYSRIQRALSRPEGRERSSARAKALNALGFIFWLENNIEAPRPELEEALSIGTELDDRLNIALALRNLGLLELIHQNHSEARTFLEQSIEQWRILGSAESLGYSMALVFLGDVALSSGDTKGAQSLYEEAVSVLMGPSVGDINFLGYPLRRLAQVAWREGRFAEAGEYCGESLRLNRAISDPRGVLCCLAGFAAIARAQGYFERAALLMAAVEAQLAMLSIRLLFMDRMEYERSLAGLRERLTETDLRETWQEGRKMSLDEAVHFALAKA
jgi:non-specific serine/threonine protein kinase